MTGLDHLDWAICGSYLAAVIVVGIWCGRRQHTNEDYFVAGRKMHWGAIGVSLFATGFSSLSFVGLPREAAYADYHLYLSILFIPFFVTPVVCWLFIPVFHRLQVTSAYEYLECRFSRLPRLIGSLLYTVFSLSWMGTLLYAVGLIVQIVLGLDDSQLIWALVVLGLFTTLYTALGGIEAVIWTDVMQTLTLGVGMGIVLILALGRIDGGLASVWELALQHEKFNMFDLRLELSSLRGSLYSATALGMFNFLAIYATEQPIVQRFVSMPSVAAARRSMVLNGFMVAAIGLLFFVVGTTIFAFYHQTLPADAAAGSGFPHQLSREDQLLPHFILTEIAFPGLMGVLLASLFAAAMSSTDSAINSLTALVVCDWLAGRTLQLRLSRLCCVLFGLAATMSSVLFIFLEEWNVFDIIIAVSGTLLGPLLGVFLLGILVPRANSPGAVAGLIAGIMVSICLIFQDTFSHWWFAALTCLTTTLVGIAVSYLFPPPAPSKVEGLVVSAWQK